MDSDACARRAPSPLPRVMSMWITQLRTYRTITWECASVCEGRARPRRVTASRCYAGPFPGRCGNWRPAAICQLSKPNICFKHNSVVLVSSLLAASL